LKFATGPRQECAQLRIAHDNCVVRAVVERQIIRPMYLEDVYASVNYVRYFAQERLRATLG